jgi:hypothetical protein
LRKFDEIKFANYTSVRNLKVGSNFNGSKCSKLSYEQYSKLRGQAMAKRREAQAVNLRSSSRTPLKIINSVSRAKQLELCRADMQSADDKFV